jgi:O-methyltransferase
VDRAVRVRVRSEVAPPDAPSRARLVASTAMAAVRWAARPERREHAGLVLLWRLVEILCPRYVFGEPEKLWFDDAAFFRDLYSREPFQLTAERRFTLVQLLGQVHGVPGDTAECGVYRGTGSWLICRNSADAGRTHHAFDSFEGLSEPGTEDGTSWHGGDLAVGEAAVRALLEPYDARVYRGWIPDRFDEVADRRFAFVHIDVDLYQPTLDSLEFFYPRLAAGAVVVCDDYGFTTCPGAKRALDEFMADKPETILHLPTGQGIVVRAQDATRDGSAAADG